LYRASIVTIFALQRLIITKVNLSIIRDWDL